MASSEERGSGVPRGGGTRCVWDPLIGHRIAERQERATWAEGDPDRGTAPSLGARHGARQASTDARYGFASCAACLAPCIAPRAP
jgi:hypothetical protein